MENDAIEINALQAAAQETPKPPSIRIKAIDQFRGIAILLMVVGGFIGQVKLMPDLMRHTHDPEAWLTLADLVAPMFIFAIGLTFGMSYNRRKLRDSKTEAVLHFMFRYFALIGFGAAMTALENVARSTEIIMDWGVFQAIGMAGIILLVFIDLSTFKRLLIASLLLILYQFLSYYKFEDYIVTSNHAGVIGSLSWGAMLIFASCFADFYFSSKKQYLVTLLIFSVASAIAAALIIPSKLTMSLSFVMISTSVSAAGFILVDFASRYYKLKFDPLSWWGRNPIIMYFANGVVVEFLLGILLPPFLWFEAPLWLAITEAVLLLVGFTYFAWYLNSRKIYIKM